MTALLLPFDFLPFLLRFGGPSVLGGRDLFLLGSISERSKGTGAAVSVTKFGLLISQSLQS